jgi:outer membrane immunogenic protein
LGDNASFQPFSPILALWPQIAGAVLIDVRFEAGLDFWKSPTLVDAFAVHHDNGQYLSKWVGGLRLRGRVAMRCNRFGLLAFAALVVVSHPVLAADMPVKALPKTVISSDWSGWYAGVSGGYGWGRSSHVGSQTGVSTGEFDISGGIIGGTLGLNRQNGSWVYGIEADASWADIEGSVVEPLSCGGGQACTTKLRWLGTVRPRVGAVWGNWLGYATGGVAFGRTGASDTGAQGNFSGGKDRIGWTIGGGIETKFAPGWSAKLEYLHVNLGKETDYATPALVGVQPINVDFHTHIVRVGINRHFNWGSLTPKN